MSEKPLKFVLLHGSLKLSKDKTLVVGDRVELLPSFVAAVDPNGMSFVTEAHFDALVKKLAAAKAAEKAVAEKAADLKSAQDKLRDIRVNAKQLAAVESIVAAAPAEAKAEVKK